MKEIFISLHLLIDLEQEALILLKRLSGQKSVKYIYAALYLFSDLLAKSRKKQSTDLKKVRC